LLDSAAGRLGGEVRQMEGMEEEDEEIFARLTGR
jgi:hypothetical protein